MKKRLSTRRHRHRSNQSEWFWEKRHRQDISLDRIRQRGQWVQVPAPATQIQQHRSANGEEKGRPPTRGGGLDTPKNNIKNNNTVKYLIESQNTFVADGNKAVFKVAFTAEWDLKGWKKQALIQNWPRRDQSQNLYMQINDIKSGRILKFLTNSLFCFFCFLYFG